MKLFKKLTFIILIAIFYACEGPIKKSITEELTIEELSTIINTVDNFEQSYEFIESTRKLVLRNSLKKLDYKDLTYKDFHNFYINSNSTSENYKKLDSTYKAEWNKKANHYLPKVDSISKKWKNHFVENNIYKYAKLEYDKIIRYTKFGRTEKFGIKFKLYTTRKLESIKIKINIEDSELLNEFEREKSLEINKIFSRNEFTINKPVPQNLEIFITSSQRDLFYQLYPDGLNYEKAIFYSIEEVRNEGKEYFNNSHEIPFSIRQLWINQTKLSYSKLDEFTITPIIQEFFDKDFDFQFEYTKKMIDQELEESNPLAFQYVQEAVSGYTNKYTN